MEMWSTGWPSSLANGATVAYVTGLYQVLLFRSPSVSEVNYWAGRLHPGDLNSTTMAQQFANSPEALALYASSPVGVVQW